jgi:archaellin
MKRIKITVQINGVDTEIELTDAQIASIKTQKEFEFVYDKDSSYYLSTTGVSTSSNGTDPIASYHGRYRKTKEIAEQSLARNKRANRLEALAEQFGGLREFDDQSIMFYIYKQYDKWSVCSLTTTFFPEVVYMTKECAETIADMLNSGKFTL